MKAALLCLFSVVLIHANVAPNTKHVINKEWWETTTFYQIYPRSFKDSDGNGVGDLKGIISKLPYLKELGIGGTWLSPIFKSPMKDFGYDISDFYDVDPLFGTMADLEELFRQAKLIDLKIILDFVPNHSSDESEWFKKSVLREGIYTDYYVWRDAKIVNGSRTPPNNWPSVFYGSAWEWNEQRQQYYLHQFDKGQPDLNYRNPAVVEEMKNVLRFWLDKGASGFRVDAIEFLFEIEDYRDEGISGLSTDPLQYSYTVHEYNAHQNETYDMVYQWRTLLDDYQKTHGGEARIMMTESYGNTPQVMEYYKSNDGTRLGSQMPFNFVLIMGLNENSTASDFKNVIDTRLAAVPVGHVANWVIGNHDQPRVGSRYGSEKVDALLTLVMTLPGIAITYMGEEIGMLDNREGISWKETLDPAACNTNEMQFKQISRDPERTPFQWDDSNMAGFTNGTSTWLPINPNYPQLNLKKQKEDLRSTFKYYKELIELRKLHTFMDGGFKTIVINNQVLAYVRSLTDHETYVVLINLSEREQVIDVSKLTSDFGNKLEVVVTGAESSFNTGDILQTNDVTLRKYNTVVFKNTASGTASLSFVLLVLASALRYLFV